MSDKAWLETLDACERPFRDMAKAEGTYVNFQTERMFAVQAFQKSTYLQGCESATISHAFLQIPVIGLSLNPATQYAALVPRKPRRDMKQAHCFLDIMYRGMLKLATDSGSIIWAKGMLVYAQDQFESLGVDRMPVHKFNPFAKKGQRGELIGGYSVAKLHNGDYMVDTMTAEDFAKIQNLSQESSNSPWKKWPEEMCLKTLIKHGQKSWPKTERLARGIEILNAHQGIDFDQTPAPEVEPEAKPDTITPEQATELEALRVTAKLNLAKLLEAFDIEQIADLPAKRFGACKARLQTAIQSRKQKEAAA